jgi:GDP-mannose 6-dehydrogenase
MTRRGWRIRTFDHDRGGNSLRIAVFGLGYVGVTSACCIASEGHEVLGFDISESKVRQINDGIAPIVEPGVNEYLKDAKAQARLSAYTTIGDKLTSCHMAIVCVGTPSAPDGSHNMSYVAEVTRQIAHATRNYAGAPLTVAYRSTFRPGTIEGLIAPIFAAELGENFQKQIELVYNPEFLRESSAVKDYFKPPKIVIGTQDGQPSARMEELHANISAPTFHVRFGEAELTKFVDNTWHATKVAFMNEIGRVCLQLGLSAAKVHEIFVSDTKLNVSPYYLRPGGAFGGSCLPKDVRALQFIAAESGANAHLIDSLIRSNDAHKLRLLQMATEGLAPGASVLLVGVAFKANTDDLRESPNIDLVRGMLQSGFGVSIFDPAVDTSKLVGANFGYAYTQLPNLSKLLVGKREAESRHFDRVVIANATVEQLDLRSGLDLVDLNRLS